MEIQRMELSFSETDDGLHRLAATAGALDPAQRNPGGKRLAGC